LYCLNEFLVGFLDVRVLADGLPKISGIDIDISTRVFLFLGDIENTCATKYEVKVGEVSSKFSRLLRVEAGRASISSSWHGDDCGDAHCNWDGG